MNETIKSLVNHRSIRKYASEDIAPDQLQAIVDAAQSAPSSIGGQQVSIIAIRDKNSKAKISELAGNQPYINQAPVFLLFCADFNRARIACELNGEKLEVQNCIESVLVGAVDVGISMGYAMAAAESLDLGTVCIGAIRSHPVEVAEFAGLPEYVFPVAGLVVGHPSDWSKLKPRLPRKAVLHEEKYDNKNMKKLVEEYDKQYFGYVDQRGGEPHTWTSKIAATYKQTYYHDVRKMLEKQGFKFGLN